MKQLTPSRPVQRRQLQKNRNVWPLGTGFVVDTSRNTTLYIIIDHVGNSRCSTIPLSCALGKHLQRAYPNYRFSLSAENDKHISFTVREIYEDAKQLSSKNLAFSNDPHKFEMLLKAYEIHSLYHITHIDNLANIFLRKGLWCHNKVTEHVDVSNVEIQEHRGAKIVPFYKTLTLHDFVPLFFAPKSPMLSALRENQHELIYLHINPDVLGLISTVFCDGNARSNATTFFNTLTDLGRLDWKLLRDHYWGADEVEKHAENKRKRSAEVLVLDRVETKHIAKITVRSYDILKRVQNICVNAGVDIRVEIQPRFYFV